MAILTVATLTRCSSCSRASLLYSPWPFLPWLYSPWPYSPGARAAARPGYYATPPYHGAIPPRCSSCSRAWRGVPMRRRRRLWRCGSDSSHRSGPSTHMPCARCIYACVCASMRVCVCGARAVRVQPHASPPHLHRISTASPPGAHLQRQADRGCRGRRARSARRHRRVD